jgi:hypothetical protein
LYRQSLDGTVDYQELISYARASRCYDSIEQSTRNHSPPISTAPISLVDLCSGHPLIGLVDFVQFFGIQIFTLWKYSLLRRRIIFLTSCPVDSACTYGM